MLHVLVGLSTMTGGNMNYFWPLGARRVMLCDSSAVLLLFVWPNFSPHPLTATPLQRPADTGDSEAKSPLIGYF